MKQSIIITLALLSAPLATIGAHEWTLKECADYAVAHNISVRQYENARRQQELRLSTARNSRLPSVDAGVGQNFAFGRGLTSDNTYTNRNTASTSVSLSTSVPLFTGFQIPNSIQLNKLNLEAAVADLAKAKEDIRMQVAKAYVEILYGMEIRDVAHRQVAIDSMQVERLREMAGNGKASEAELSQQKAAMAQSKLTATQADNSYQLALLALSQLLELPSPEGFAIVRPDVSQLPLPGVQPVSPDVVYAEALGVKPDIQAQQLRLQGMEKQVKIAQSELLPQLSLSAGLGTSYYKVYGFGSEAMGRQFKHNFNQYIGLNLSVPIFHRFATRNSIRSARIDRETQQLQLDNAKKTLYKEIQQVYYNAVAARSKYESSGQAALSSGDAFELMKAKYENGKANITEFNEAKNRFLKAQSDLVQARYEYLYQTSLLEFYRGNELKF